LNSRVESCRAVPLTTVFRNRSFIGIKPLPLLFEELLQGLFGILWFSHDVSPFQFQRRGPTIQAVPLS
jgi:hypothetical protein